MGLRGDSRHPLKPIIANFYHVILTTIMVVNKGGASPSLVHLFIVQAGNFKWRILCGIHGALQKVGMGLYHFR
jgi:hypothetical protein